MLILYQAMRHVHSDIPAVEFARPLNAETQNTFAVLVSGVSNMYMIYSRKMKLWRDFPGVAADIYCIFNCNWEIAESILIYVHVHLCQINTTSQVCKASKLLRKIFTFHTMKANVFYLFLNILQEKSRNSYSNHLHNRYSRHLDYVK